MGINFEVGEKGVAALAAPALVANKALVRQSRPDSGLGFQEIKSVHQFRLLIPHNYLGLSDIVSSSLGMNLGLGQEGVAALAASLRVPANVAHIRQPRPDSDSGLGSHWKVLKTNQTVSSSSSSLLLSSLELSDIVSSSLGMNLGLGKEGVGPGGTGSRSGECGTYKTVTARS